MAEIRACTICSGSSANSVYIEIDGNAILIDAGCTEKNLTAFLREINSSYEANYADSTLNFFGVSSGIRYQNLDSNTFESH